MHHPSEWPLHKHVGPVCTDTHTRTLPHYTLSQDTHTTHTHIHVCIHTHTRGCDHTHAHTYLSLTCGCTLTHVLSHMWVYIHTCTPLPHTYVCCTLTHTPPLMLKPPPSPVPIIIKWPEEGNPSQHPHRAKERNTVRSIFAEHHLCARPCPGPPESSGTPTRCLFTVAPVCAREQRGSEGKRPALLHSPLLGQTCPKSTAS